MANSQMTTYNFGAGPVPAHHHTNPDGSVGGWVATTATVAATATVGPNAQVYGSAQIGNNARISGNAQISSSAQVSGKAWVFGSAQVFGNARVCGKARVCGSARIYDSAQISSSARIYDNAQDDNKTYKDTSEIYLNKLDPLSTSLVFFKKATPISKAVSNLFRWSHDNKDHVAINSNNTILIDMMPIGTWLTNNPTKENKLLALFLLETLT